MAINTVKNLIEKSYKLASLYRADRILEGSKQQEALSLLNDLLDSFATTPAKVAFYKILQFPIVANKQTYILAPSGGDVVSNRLLSLKYCTVISSDMRYYVRVMSDKDYYTVTYNTTAAARPWGVFLQNEVGKSSLTFFYKPDVNYTCEIKGKFILSNVGLNDSLTDLPAYYTMYLKFLMAKHLALEYMPSNWTQSHEMEFNKLEKQLEDINDYDLSVRETDDLLDNRSRWGYKLGVIT